MSAASQAKGLVTTYSKLFAGESLTAWGLIGNQNPCANMYGTSDDWWMFGNTSTRDIPYIVCYMNNTDLVDFNQQEVDVLKCLTNLHFTQGDSCITDDACTDAVEGGYEGHIESLRIPSAFEDGSDNDDLMITDDQSATLQEAWQSLGDSLKGGVRGSEVGAEEHPPGPYVFMARELENGAWTDEGQRISDWSLPGMQVNWEGMGLADC